MSSAALLPPPPDSTLLKAALRYAARGWAVFPLAPGTKVPLKGSNGVKDATKNTDQIRSWWTKNPDANIGGCTVLDVDTKDGLAEEDRKSTRLNSSHANISYAVFCLK